MFRNQGFVTDIQFYRDNTFEAGIKTNIKYMTKLFLSYDNPDRLIIIQINASFPWNHSTDSM